VALSAADDFADQQAECAMARRFEIVGAGPASASTQSSNGCGRLPARPSPPNTSVAADPQTRPLSQAKALRNTSLVATGNPRIDHPRRVSSASSAAIRVFADTGHHASA